MPLTSSLRRATARLAAAALVATAVVPALAPNAGATGSFALTRVSGQDRYATAVELSKGAYTSASTVVLAQGLDFPDALAGSFLAGTQGAPVLLTRRDTLPDVTRSEIARLGAAKVYLLGGEAAISKAIEDDLKATYSVARLAGTGRYDTARLVALEGGASGSVGTVDGKKAAFVTTGRNYADALAAGPLAFAARLPVILTEPDQLSPDAKSALQSLGIQQAVILGGTQAVSTQVQNDLLALGLGTTRLEATSREGTAARIADYALAKLGFSTAKVDLARSNDFADGLAGAAYGAKNGPAPTLLTPPTALADATRSYLTDRAETLTGGAIFGGIAAVSAAVKTAAEDAARMVSGEVVRFDTTKKTYTYVPQGGNTATTVTYASGDQFRVDGQAATLGAFEAALSTGDRARTVPGNPQTHDLTNVDQSTINNRTAGNVDIANKVFDFINDVTGDFVVQNINYAPTGATYTVDGATATVAQFEADINEGDVVSISNNRTAFALTNKAVTGPANTITVSSALSQSPTADLKIGPYGDIVATGSDPGPGGSPNPNGAGNDDRYHAGDTGTNADVFTGDATTAQQFHDQLTEGDLVTYTRAGGVETYNLVNKPLASITGTAKSITKDGDGIPGNDSTDGGSMVLTLSDGTDRTITYKAQRANTGDRFEIDGKAATEGEFETQFSAGDLVEYQPQDANVSPPQPQVIKLTNR